MCCSARSGPPWRARSHAPSFVASFISNVLIAAAIVYIGDQIGLFGSQLATGVVGVVLGIRIFTNAAAIRRALFHA